MSAAAAGPSADGDAWAPPPTLFAPPSLEVIARRCCVYGKEYQRSVRGEAAEAPSPKLALEPPLDAESDPPPADTALLDAAAAAQELAYKEF